MLHTLWWDGSLVAYIGHLQLGYIFMTYLQNIGPWLHTWVSSVWAFPLWTVLSPDSEFAQWEDWIFVSKCVLDSGDCDPVYKWSGITITVIGLLGVLVNQIGWRLWDVAHPLSGRTQMHTYNQVLVFFWIACILCFEYDLVWMAISDYYRDIKWASYCLKSLAPWLFVQ